MALPFQAYIDSEGRRDLFCGGGGSTLAVKTAFPESELAVGRRGSGPFNFWIYVHFTISVLRFYQAILVMALFSILSKGERFLGGYFVAILEKN